MERLAQGLIVLLRDMAINELWQDANPIKRKNKALFFDDKPFAGAFIRRYSNYSESEAATVYNAIKMELENRKCSHAGVLGLIHTVADRFFVLHSGEMRCRNEKFLDWRDVTRETGQIPFMCAWLAMTDLKHGNIRSKFSFHPNVRTDDYRLQQVLYRGRIAENHYHLYPSAPVFDMAWLCLMNHINARSREFDSLEPTFFKSDSGLYDDVARAAVIRAYLWNLLETNEPPSSLDSLRIGKQLRFGASRAGEINSHFISPLRIIRRFASSGKLLDYAAPPSSPKVNAYSAFAGENYFQYRMFYHIYSGSKIFMKQINLFAFYLMVSMRLRSELVQCNSAIGFANFQQYQGRKDLFINNNRFREYKDAFDRIAVNASFENRSLVLLEARVGPDKKMKHSTRRLFRPAGKGYPCYRENNCEMRKKKRCTNDWYYCKFYEEHFLIVPSVPKRNDTAKIHSHYYQCRHHKYRKTDIAKKSKIVMDLLEDGSVSNMAHLIYALDACSQEIGCRPEVFAPAFRAVRINTEFVARDKRLKKDARPLRLTYHAGEDFLDIADGLRAIDEAVRFLQMRNADRLGHALALGICPVEWYKLKEMQICLPRQDLIDNAAWLHMKASELGIIHSSIYELEQIFWKHFRIVWGEWKKQEREKADDIRITDYFDAWRLRGDDPEYYLTGKVNPLYKGFLREDEDVELIRKAEGLPCKIYLAYHFDPSVRERGTESVIHTISESYVALVADVQKAMQRDIADKGISIECNPTSNYLIGTFKNFERHPIFNWNSFGLSAFGGKSPRLHVSINTDDQGVFATDLESEYAILACALKKMRNENGQSLHKAAEIYDWIEHMRKMGVEQSFRSLDDL